MNGLMTSPLGASRTTLLMKSGAIVARKYVGERGRGRLAAVANGAERCCAGVLCARIQDHLSSIRATSPNIDLPVCRHFVRPTHDLDALKGGGTVEEVAREC